jgi:hypothetical protein
MPHAVPREPDPRLWMLCPPFQYFEDSAKPDAIKRKIMNGEQMVNDKHVLNFIVGEGWVEAQVQGDMA